MGEPIIYDGREYYTAQDVAAQWGIKEKTVRNYASPKQGKIRGCVHQGEDLLVPADAIIPIDRGAAQSLIWLLIHFKAGFSSFVDLTNAGISNDKIQAVLLDLERQQLVVLDRGADGG